MNNIRDYGRPAYESKQDMHREGEREIGTKKRYIPKGNSYK